MSQRWAGSKRNELIANFMEGKEDPEYEVISSNDLFSLEAEIEVWSVKRWQPDRIRSISYM